MGKLGCQRSESHISTTGLAKVIVQIILLMNYLYQKSFFILKKNTELSDWFTNTK